MSRPKQLHVAMAAACPFPANRGTPSRVLGMAEALTARGHRVTVVTYHFGLDSGNGSFEIVRTPRMPYSRFRPGPTLTKLLLLDPLLSLQLMRVVKKKKVDLIHAHHFEGALAGFPVRRIRGVPVIYDAHTTLKSELPAYSFLNIRWLAEYLDRRVPEWADHVVACSDTLRDIMVGSGVAEEKIDVIPTGVHAVTFESADGSGVRSRHGLDGRPIVMYTGSLAPFQGVDLLVHAMRKVIDRHPEAVLFLVVDSRDSRIMKACDELGIRKNVILEAVRDFEAVPRYLAAADIAVSPRTDCAGFPQKIANYMAAGKAIVCFEGSAKLITHEQNGLIASGSDPEALAGAIIRLLEESDLRKRLGVNAKETLRGNLDWACLGARLEETYYRLLNHHERGTDGDAV
ncbi:MAG: glycosyltransferase family 4 protein [Candidatus Eisenbacteria bacterium]